MHFLMQRYRKVKAKSGQINYEGPVLAGDRLIVAGSNGTLININPANGSFQNQTNAGSALSLPLVVANKTLYVLTDAGRLIAYR